MGITKFFVVFTYSLYISLAAPPEGDRSYDDFAVPPTTNVTHPTIHPTHAPVVIRSRYVTKDGTLWHTKPHNQSSIRIQATQLVTEEAVIKGGKTMAGMVKDMPQEIFERVANSNGVRLFSWTQGMTIYPEMAVHADTPECHNVCSGKCHITCAGNRKLSHIAGLTGAYSYASANVVLCNKHDGYHSHLNVLAHEFSHLIMAHVGPTWHQRIRNAYLNARTNNLWEPRSYLMSNQNEYWAEASGSFFMFTHMLWTSGGMNKCGKGGYNLCPTVTAAREFIHKKDPQIYAILDYVYTNNQGDVENRVKPCM